MAKKRMKTDEANEWFKWSIRGQTQYNEVLAAPAHSREYKLCPHIGRQTADGKLTSIMEVRRLEFGIGGLTDANVSTAGTVVALLSRGPHPPPLTGPAAATEATLYYGSHPQVYESMHIVHYTYQFTDPFRVDYCEGGNTGLLIWNPNIWTHLTSWKGVETPTLFVNWYFRLYARIRMVSSEEYARNQLAFATVQHPHTEDKPEAEHVDDEMQQHSWPRAAAEYAYQQAGQYVTEAAGTLVSGAVGAGVAALRRSTRIPVEPYHLSLFE